MHTSAWKSLLGVLFVAALAVSARAQDDEGGGGGGGGGGGRRGGGAVSLPDETSPSIKLRTPAPYPYDLLVAGTEGYAKLMFDVGADGFPLNIRLVKASHPEFGLAAMAAAETWEYKPATRNQHPVRAVDMNRTVKFSLKSKDVAVDETVTQLLAELAKEQPDIAKAKDLDAQPKATVVARPVFPEALLRQGATTGSATIEAIIDKEGKVRLPKVVEASDPAFGYAAAVAMLRWQFVPPTKGGQPVCVRIRLPLSFTPPPPKAPGPGAGPRDGMGGHQRPHKKGDAPPAETPSASDES